MSSDIRDKNMIVQSFKNKGLRGEVIALIMPIMVLQESR